jgi:hypothetical protein
MNKHHLTSGLDSEQQAELGDLRQLEAALQTYESPKPDSARLLAELQPLMPQPVTPRPDPVSKDWRYRLRLTHMQLSLVDGTFWWVSGLLLGLGVLLLIASGGIIAGFFALISPVLAVAGTAYIFRPEMRSLRDFELLSAVKPLELLYTRLLLILVYNTGLALTLILLASSQDTQLVLWRLLLIWLGPMVGLTGVALYSMLRWNLLAGVLLPMSSWSLLLFVGWRDAVLQTRTLMISVEVFSQVVTQSDTLLLASILALVVGIVLVWRSGRWTTYKEI